MSIAEFNIDIPFESDRSTPLRWVRSHLGRQKLLIFTMFLGAFGNAALGSAVPLLIGEAFNFVDSDGAIGISVAAAALWIVASQLTRSVLQLGRNFSAELIGQRLERDARAEFYVSLLGKSMSFHDSQPVGDTMARATNDVREMNLMLNPGINLVVGSGWFMMMPVLLSWRYHPALLLAPVFYLVTYIIALVRYLNVLRPIADRVRLAFGRLNSRLAEAIDGIELVKSTAQEDAEVERFRTNATEFREAVVAQGRVEARYLPLLLLGVTIALGFTHAIILFQQDAITIGDVIGYSGLLTLFYFPTFVSLFAYSQVARGMAGARRILQLMEVETKLDENRGGFDGTVDGAIAFEAATFGYVDDVNVLEDISFTVEPGQTVAIVGQTGAGKSTVAKLVNRTYDVTEGQVLIDGRDIREWNLAALRRQISIIEQDIFLFSRTLAENIAFGKPDATREEIEAAARDAQAHDFILEFEDGYDTVVGERGVTLSGGQRQRIALARAFLADPRILILDDSTSAVDSATEDKIQQAIARAAERQTTILITHRLSQIRWADKVVLLRKGRVVGVGDHDALMASYPAYRRIFEQYDS